MVQGTGGQRGLHLVRGPEQTAAGEGGLEYTGFCQPVPGQWEEFQNFFNYYTYHSHHYRPTNDHRGAIEQRPTAPPTRRQASGHTNASAHPGDWMVTVGRITQYQVQQQSQQDREESADHVRRSFFCSTRQGMPGQDLPSSSCRDLSRQQGWLH